MYRFFSEKFDVDLSRDPRGAHCLPALPACPACLVAPYLGGPPLRLSASTSDSNLEGVCPPCAYPRRVVLCRVVCRLLSLCLQLSRTYAVIRRFPLDRNRDGLFVLLRSTDKATQVVTDHVTPSNEEYTRIRGCLSAVGPLRRVLSCYRRGTGTERSGRSSTRRVSAQISASSCVLLAIVVSAHAHKEENTRHTGRQEIPSRGVKGFGVRLCPMLAIPSRRLGVRARRDHRRDHRCQRVLLSIVERHETPTTAPRIAEPS